MSSTPPRKLARVAGVFWILTFVTSIPALILYAPVLNHAHYVLGAGADTRIAFGAFLEVILVIANIGTAVTMFPILKAQTPHRFWSPASRWSPFISGRFSSAPACVPPWETGSCSAT